MLRCLTRENLVSSRSHVTMSDSGKPGEFSSHVTMSDSGKPGEFSSHVTMSDSGKPGEFSVTCYDG